MKPHADAVRHDCGEHGALTVREIMAASGLSLRSIRRRLEAGVKGAGLCAPWRPGKKPPATFRDSMTIPDGVSQTVYVACLIARRYPLRAPKARDLHAEFGMGMSQAFKWARALREAQRTEPTTIKTRTRRIVGRPVLRAGA